jgi:hypothetical protein
MATLKILQTTLLMVDSSYTTGTMERQKIAGIIQEARGKIPTMAGHILTMIQGILVGWQMPNFYLSFSASNVSVAGLTVKSINKMTPL